MASNADTAGADDAAAVELSKDTARVVRATGSEAGTRSDEVITTTAVSNSLCSRL